MNLRFSASTALVMSALLGFGANAEAKGNSCDAVWLRDEDTSSLPRDALFDRARDASTLGNYGIARGHYLLLLSRDAEDADARSSLARIDSWEGCYALAIENYKKVLAKNPYDEEARAGLIDVLGWSGELSEARAELAEGRRLMPNSPALLVRSSRLAYWSGDATQAAKAIDAAARFNPEDAEAKALMARIFMGEARLTARVDFAPPGYPDTYTLTAQVMQRYKRFELTLGEQMGSRAGADSRFATLDGRRYAIVAYHPYFATTVGIELGHSAPARVFPWWQGRAFAEAPLFVRGLTGGLSYAYWRYKRDKEVQIITPALNLALREDLAVEGRIVIAHVNSIAEDGARVDDTSLSFGIRGTWAYRPTTAIALDYTYGVSVEQTPNLSALVSLRSHILTAIWDQKLPHRFGIRPLLAVERRVSDRNPDTLFIWSAELGGYIRW